MARKINQNVSIGFGLSLRSLLLRPRACEQEVYVHSCGVVKCFLLLGLHGDPTVCYKGLHPEGLRTPTLGAFSFSILVSVFRFGHATMEMEKGIDSKVSWIL